jgi:hypothetical protein
VFNVVNPRAARDNHLQGAVDVIQTLRAAQVAPFTVGALTIGFDASKTYYFGHSQGSNVGILGVSVSSEAKAAVFSGAGSYLSQGIMSKTSPVDAAAALQFVVGEPLTTGHPIMTIWQTFFDPIDPINYDALVIQRPPAGIPSKHVLMTYGIGDTYAPENTLQLTARTMRLQQGDPLISTIPGLAELARPLGSNRVGGDGVTRTAIVVQYQPGNYDGHFVAQENAAAVTDWTAFFDSAATSGTPTIP